MLFYLQKPAAATKYLQAATEPDGFFFCRERSSLFVSSLNARAEAIAHRLSN